MRIYIQSVCPMARACFMLFVLAGVMAFITAPAAAEPSSTRVSLCHIPPDDPTNAHTITVSEGAVPAHLKHGDTLGECPSGCAYASECDDGDACTADLCLNGQRSHPDTSSDCDDSNICTADSCDPAIGCINTPIQSACEDGDVCTRNDTCAADQCVGDAILGCCRSNADCDDSEGCTIDSCTVATGECSHAVVTCAAPPNVCTVNVCDPTSGLCETAPVSCNDSNPDTMDSCDPTSGCINASWQVSPFGQCSALCGDGVQTRTVVCKDQFGNTVADANCPQPKPAQQQSCNLLACIYGWQVFPFGQCSAPCGGGLMTRQVLCMDQFGNVVADANYPQPKPTEQLPCNTQSCP